METNGHSRSSNRQPQINNLPVFGNDKVSLIELKSLAQKMLTMGSIFLILILSEPDFLPRREAIAKVELYVRLLYEEVARKRIEG
ncbi:MAG: hypothetical protein ABSB40_07670 [Nitrososphaeria archaeon]|jgi:hypothetical protein